MQFAVCVVLEHDQILYPAGTQERRHQCTRPPTQPIFESQSVCEPMVSRTTVFGALALFCLLRYLRVRARKSARVSFHSIPRQCVVTGAGSGIGRATTKRLLGLGHSVIGLDVNDAALAALAAEEATAVSTGRLSVRRLDVTDANQWREFYKSLADAGVAVHAHLNIAGVLAASKAYEFTPSLVRSTCCLRVY